MKAFDDVYQQALKSISVTSSPGLSFVKYNHHSICGKQCALCKLQDNRIFSSADKIALPQHTRCDCFYTNIPSRKAGTISIKQPPPDLWLKKHDNLPDYYITKKEAEELGWERGKDLSKFAPGKMIGGDIFHNYKSILPIKSGRIWFECDIDYTSGLRNGLRLYYSNDGLMFFSPDHGQTFFHIY